MDALGSETDKRCRHCLLAMELSDRSLVRMSSRDEQRRVEPDDLPCLCVTQGGPPHRGSTGPGREGRRESQVPDDSVQCRGRQSCSAGLRHDGLCCVDVLRSGDHLCETLPQQVRCVQVSPKSKSHQIFTTDLMFCWNGLSLPVTGTRRPTAPWSSRTFWRSGWTVEEWAWLHVSGFSSTSPSLDRRLTSTTMKSQFSSIHWYSEPKYRRGRPCRKAVVVTPVLDQIGRASCRERV